MEMSYQDAMGQLRSMFTTFDEETIKTVLTSNDGHVERTIEDLLKMNDDDQRHKPNQDDDNLFADSGPKHRNYNNDNLFDEPHDLFRSDSNNDWHARQKQEKEDAALAYKLQREYMQQEAQGQQQIGRSQQRRPQENPYASYSNNNYPSNPQSNNYPPAGSHMDSNPYPQSYAQSNPYAQSNAQYEAQASHEDSKKKPGIMTKMKASFNSLFHRKKGKKQAPTHNPGNYAEIENLEENDVYNLNDDGPLRGNEQNANHDDDAPMQLDDVLNPHGARALDSDEEDHYNQNQRGGYNYNQNYNQNQRLPQENYGYH